MRKAVTVATRVLGAEDRLTIKLGGSLGQHLYWDPDASLGQLRESVALLESNYGISKRVLGCSHPTTDLSKRDLVRARLRLRAAEESGGARGPPTPSPRRGTEDL